MGGVSLDSYLVFKNKKEIHSDKQNDIVYMGSFLTETRPEPDRLGPESAT